MTPSKTSRKRFPRRTISRWLFATLCAAGLAVAGCKQDVVKPAVVRERYPIIPDDPTLPTFLKGSIKDITVTSNTGNYVVSSYGLVTGLHNTGDSTAPSVVREWMIKEMQRHKIGSISAGSDTSPEQMLNDPHVAVVGVLGFIPPGARKGDWIDVKVGAMPGNNTTSLADGILYRTSLKIDGLGPDPFGSINEYAKAQGTIFVNPAYALSGSTAQGGARVSLRTGMIPHGGIVTSDRPIILVMRHPSWAASRSVQYRINQRFQDLTIAAAQDEGYLHLLVPRGYGSDWEHFVGIVTHLYMNASPDFGVLKAKELAGLATTPNAPLMDISYCWEGIGPSAMPFITPLLSSPQQDVQFAAARAAAFLGDRYGEEMLMQIAGSTGHAFQINAVQTLGKLPSSPLINAALAKLLDSSDSLARIEAYKVLCRNNDAHIFTKVIKSQRFPENEFVLDLIASDGPPLIYCSRMGQPRLAVFGRKVSLATPVTFAAFDNRLTIATVPEKPRTVNIFYRSEGPRPPIAALSGPDVGELVARLGGATDEGFHFSYGDIVALLMSMSDTQKLAAAFVLERLPYVQQQIDEAPSLLAEQSRPQGDPGRGGAAIGASLPDLPMPIPSTQPAPNKPQ